MSDTKDLLAAIITGKDYNQTFTDIMNKKAYDLVNKERDRIAQALFSDKTSDFETKENFTDK